MYTRIFPNALSKNINKYAAHLDRLMPEYGINTPLRRAHFLSQLAVESGELSATEENLRYSATRLTQVFPTYFRTMAAAQAVAYKPEAIANIVYANRIGNGPASTGDGYRFRGRGLIQLTGRDNYTDYLRHLQTLPVNTLDTATLGIFHGCSNPDHLDQASLLAPLLTDPVHAVRSACWFWQTRGLNEIADRGDTDAVITAVTRRVNGGTNGLSQRKVYFYRAYPILKAQ